MGPTGDGEGGTRVGHLLLEVIELLEGGLEFLLLLGQLLLARF